MPQPIDDSKVKDFLGKLSRYHQEIDTAAPDTLEGSDSEHLSKSVRQFGNLMVGKGKQEPAQWSADQRKYIEHFKGSTFIGIGAIAKKVAQQEAKVSRRVQKKSGIQYESVKLSNPLLKLFEHVNQIHVQYDLWYQMVAWRLTTGNSYFWKARNGFNTVTELWPLPSQMVWAVPSRERFIGSYIVRGVWGEDVEIDAKDILHIRNSSIDWSGNGRFYGDPAVRPGAMAVDIEDQIFRRLYHHFKNFSPPGLLYTTDAELTEDQFMDVVAQTMYTHSKAEHAGMPIFSHSGMRVSEFRQSVREMDYSNSLETVMDYILAIIGTPKAIVGLSKDFNRANYIGAMISWIENTINPLLVHIGQALTQELASEFDENLIVHFDPCTVSDRDAIRKDIETAQKAGAVTPNEVRDQLLNIGPFEVGGNVAGVPNSVTSRHYGNDQAEIDQIAEMAEKQQEAKQSGKQPGQTPLPEDERTDRERDDQRGYAANQDEALESPSVNSAKAEANGHDTPVNGSALVNRVGDIMNHLPFIRK